MHIYIYRTLKNTQESNTMRDERDRKNWNRHHTVSQWKEQKKMSNNNHTHMKRVYFSLNPSQRYYYPLSCYEWERVLGSSFTLIVDSLDSHWLMGIWPSCQFFRLSTLLFHKCIFGTHTLSTTLSLSLYRIYI